MVKKNKIELILDTLDEFEDREDFLGYGYLGNSFRTGDTDRYLIKAANFHGIEKEDLFMWCNSKWGRWEAENSGLGNVTMKRLKQILPEQVDSLRKDEGMPPKYTLDKS